jgi:ATP-dependent Lon protease
MISLRTEMSPTILVVDDEVNLLVLLDRTLSKEGYDVRTTTDAYEALELLEKENIGVAILDIRMYPIDGVALLTEIKRLSPSTQVVMMTGVATADTRDYCLKSGAARCLAKPIEISKLKSMVRELIPA